MKSSKKITAVLVAVLLCVTAFIPLCANAEKDPVAAFVSTAEAEIGFIKSGTGKSKYESAFDSTDGEWSVSFLTWCAFLSDIPETIFPHCTSISSFVSFFREQGAFLSASVVTPAVGTVAVLYTDATYTASKVGLVTDFDKERNRVDIITVAEKKEIVKVTYATDSRTIAGYCRPAFGLIDGYRTGYYRMQTSVYFREAPGTLSPKIVSETNPSVPVQIPANTHLKITKINNQWGYTEYNGVFGWVLLTFAEYIAPIGSVTEKSLLLACVSDAVPAQSFDFSALSVSGLDGFLLRLGRRENTDTSSFIREDSSCTSFAAAFSEPDLHFGFFFESNAVDSVQSEQEAQYCVNILRSLSVKPDLPIFLSLPDYSSSEGSAFMNKGICSDIVSVFCSTLENAGFYVGIHASGAVLRTYIASEILENRPLWFETPSESSSLRSDIITLSKDGLISGCSEQLCLCLCEKDYPSLIRTSGLNGYGKEEHPSTTAHTHSPGDWETQIFPSCTTNGSKIRRCTVPGCNRITHTVLIPALGHKTIQYVVSSSSEVSAGESISTQWQTVIPLSDDEKNAEAFEIIKNDGGSLISVCEQCGIVTKSIVFHPDSACNHALSLSEGTYTSSVPVYMRTGPAVGYDKKTNESGHAIYLKAGASFRLIFTMGQWGFVECENYYGWILLSYSTKIAKSEYPNAISVRKQACESDGLTAVVCHQCKNTALTYLSAATAHPHTTQITVKGTCMENGSITEVCSDCGAVLSFTATGLGEHAFAGNISVAPTAQMPGRAFYSCPYCGKSAGVEIPVRNMFDVTQDGIISSADARIALRMSVKLEPTMMTQAAIARADADGDGKITAADARLILRLCVHLTTAENILVMYYSIS